jgi:hypothetical protein
MACICNLEENCGACLLSRKNELLKVHEIEKEYTNGMPLSKVIISRIVYTHSCVHVNEDSLICSFHLTKYSTEFDRGTICHSPLHAELCKKRRQHSLRRMTATIQDFLFSLFPDSTIPFGGKICAPCRKKVGRLMHSEEDKVDDPLYDVPEPLIEESDLDTSGKKLEAITEAAGVSPVKFRIVSTSVPDLSSSTMRYTKRKYDTFMKACKKQFLEGIAPCQAKALEDILSPASSDFEYAIPQPLKPLLEAYNVIGSRQGRRFVLSLVPESIYTNKYLSELFECSDYEIRAAQALKKSNGTCSLESFKKSTHKQKLDRSKVQHFIEFLFENNCLMDVAYGTTKVKFDSGLYQVIPHIVLTALKQHIIQQYGCYCQHQEYLPLSSSVLRTVLDCLNASQRKSLAGLDNVTAAALEAFDSFLEMIKLYSTDKSLAQKIHKSKVYLKLGYSIHCDMDSHCKSHCIAFALFDKSDPDFQVNCDHDHHEKCRECEVIFSMLSEMELLATSKNEEILYDFSIHKNSVIEYMCHNLRGKQQNKAKNDALLYVSEHSGSALWIRDWSQKVIPQKYREGQKEYFGKKGMSLHVDVFILNEGGVIKKITYFTCFDYCEQNMVDTLCVAEHVISQFSIDFPNCKTLFAKSDNAGCYTGNGYAQLEWKICRWKNIALKRHDYSEPQHGKDQADRESALAKRYLSAFLNSGHDILNAKNMRDGIMYENMIKNAKVSVISIHSTKVEGIPKIKQLSQYHSVEFHDDEMTFYRYYSIGKGKTISLVDISFDANIHIQAPFSDYSNSDLNPNKKKQLNEQILFCSNSNCTLTFALQHDLDSHLLLENHEIQDSKSSKDQIRSVFVQQLKQRPTTHSILMQSSSSLLGTSDYSHTCSTWTSERGWALPIHKYVQHSLKQKQFFQSLYVSGNKYTTHAALKLMREAVSTTGAKLFAVEEYLTISQIKSLFSRLGKPKNVKVTAEFQISN